MWQLKGICSITLTLYSDKTAVVFAAAAFSAFIQCSFVFTARKYFVKALHPSGQVRDAEQGLNGVFEWGLCRGGNKGNSKDVGKFELMSRWRYV
jgi:hypothetical protein